MCSASYVQPYFQMAEQYTFGDRMFQTNQGPSFPAHQFIISGTSAPTATSNLFVAENAQGVSHASGLTGCLAPPAEFVYLIDPTGNRVQHHISLPGPSHADRRAQHIKASAGAITRRPPAHCGPLPTRFSICVDRMSRRPTPRLAPGPIGPTASSFRKLRFSPTFLRGNSPGSVGSFPPGQIPITPAPWPERVDHHG